MTCTYIVVLKLVLVNIGKQEKQASIEENIITLKLLVKITYNFLQCAACINIYCSSVQQKGEVILYILL